MKPTLLPIILLSSAIKISASEVHADQEEVSYFPDWLVPFFSPEGAAMLEKINKPPRTSKYVSLGTRANFDERAAYNRESMQNHVNTLNLSDTESEDEIEKLVRADQVHDRLELHLSDGVHSTSNIYNLNEEFFAAAVQLGKVDRLRGLLAKNKHLLLTPEQKAKALKFALIACKDGKDTAAFSEMFKMLLQNNFYPKDGTWPRTNWSDDTDFPLYSIVRDPILYQPFLDYDKDTFVKETKENYIMEFIRLRQFGQAITALRLGCDPKIVGKNDGRNALDAALDNPSYWTDLERHEGEPDRRNLIRILQDEYGMEPSNTITNLEYICRLENNWERAINLVRLGGMKFERVSPIGAAFSAKNIDLVNAAIDTYLDELPASQLKFDLSFYYPSSITDQNQRSLLNKAAERVKTLKCLHRVIE